KAICILQNLLTGRRSLIADAQNLLPLNAKTRKSPYHCTRRAAQVKRFSERKEKFLADAAPQQRNLFYRKVYKQEKNLAKNRAAGVKTLAI
ncbi:MAG: hypothetical protein IIY07_06730, partial [Thermoguttaceae bacterium]|nr:hypothetical protein [Thermoguttaceae bacterium]